MLSDEAVANRKPCVTASRLLFAMKRITSLIITLSLLNLLFISVSAVNSDYGYSMLGLDKYADYLRSNDLENTVIVAVLDSGVSDIDCVHGKLVSGYDFIDDDTDAKTDSSSNSHGTRIASIIAQATKDLPVKIMPVRILEESSVTIENLVDGIKYAADHGASVINLSVGGRISDCSDIDQAIAYAENKNVSVVVAAGNERIEISQYCPAHNESAITVSSVDVDKAFANSFSNFGPFVDCCAPGVSVVAYGKNGIPAEVNGTSYSAAFISAGTALIRLNRPTVSACETQNILKSICLDLGETGADYYYGFGLPQFQKLISIQQTPHISIQRYQERIIASYKATIAFSAATTDAPEGSSVHWFVNGNDSGTGESYTVRCATMSYTIQAKLVDRGGNILAESETETVNIKTGFFARLLAFFRMIFGLLPVAFPSICK